MQRAECTIALLMTCALSFLPSVAHAGCYIDRVTVRPTGVIRPADSVSLEILIRTPTWPANLAQPTEVTIAGNEILVDLYADAGNAMAPDAIVETVELGRLAAGFYDFEIVRHPTTWCWEGQTVTGTLCVQEWACYDESCMCPVFVPTHTVLAVNAPGWSQLYGQGLNDLDEVVGRGYGPAGGQTAFLWRDGVMVDLGAFGDDGFASATDVNNLGQVVGSSAWGTRAFLWQDGEVVELGDPAIVKSAYAINDVGQIVGKANFPGSGEHAFLFEDDELTDLGTLGGYRSLAWDINELGQVVGESFTGAGERAFLWSDGVMIDLGNLGIGNSNAYGINDLGQVVGKSHREIGDKMYHAFLWEDGEMTDLGALGGFASSSAVGINNAGQIVGGGSFSSGGGCSFLYDPENGFRCLRDLVPIDSGWAALGASDINEQGHIAGTGACADGSAFLMMPVEDAPSIPAVSAWGKVILMLFVLAALTHVSRERIASP